MDASLPSVDGLPPLPPPDAAGAGELADPLAMVEIAARFGHFRIDIAAWTISWSIGVANIFGRPMPASGPRDLDEHLGFLHPDDAAALRLKMADAVADECSRGPYRNQVRVIRPDGTERHLLAQGVMLVDAMGRLIGTSGILVDVTEAIAAERTARAISEMLHATFETMDQGIVMVGADQRVRVMNRKARALLDIPEHLARADVPFADLLRHQDETGEFAHLSDADRACLPIWSEEASARLYTRRRPDGSMLEIRTAPMPDGGFVRTYSDITEHHANHVALLASEERYRLLAETTTDTVILADLDSTRRYVSPAAKALFGYEAEELVGSRPTTFVHPDDAAMLTAALADLAREAVEKAALRYRYRRKDGTYVWTEALFSLIRDPASSAATGYVATLRDISERKAIEDQLQRSEERLAMALESGGDGVWDYDLRTGRIVLTGRWWALLGFEERRSEASLGDWLSLCHPDDVDRVRTAWREHLAEDTPPFEIEYRMRGKAGAYLWALARGQVVERSASGRAARMVGTLIDITRRKEAELAIAHLAQHDVLTGLPNRALFRERLQTRIGEARRHDDGFAVLALDLDRFKSVNDTLGHAAGDVLLREIACRLLTVIRDEDTVARLGGDEFSIVLGRIADHAEAFTVARRVIGAVERPIVIDGRDVEVGTSIGIAFGPADGQSVDELCRRADTAMYVAKANGRNTFRAYHSRMEAVLVTRATLEDDLLDAVKRGGFMLCFQPSFTLRSGEVSGFEALLRWQHPTRGPVAPDEFIPLAEQSGLMVRLGEWALREACREAARWPGTPHVAVNISGVQCRQPGLEQCVMSALAANKLAPTRLVLEIAEEVLADDSDAVFARLDRLHALGVGIALSLLDSGSSGLKHLRRFPFAAIKLHRSLVRDLGRAETAAMARAVSLCTAPGVVVVAEGVETREELKLARAVGCTAVQGFLFAEPLPPEQAARLVAAASPAWAA